MNGVIEITGWVINWGMLTQHNPRVPLGVIYYDIKRILLTNLQYYQKFTTDDLKVSLTSIWVDFAATVLEKVEVLVSTTVINNSLRDTTCAFTNIII